MALKTKEVMVTAEGRDKGKLYIITEMPAAKAEKWAARLFLAMGRSGVDVSMAMKLGGGMIAAAVMGIGALSSMAWSDAEGLLDEMMLCVQARPNPGNLDVVRALVENDPEEVETRLMLRMEVITLHTGFTLADIRLALSQMQASADTTSPNTQTSPA